MGCCRSNIENEEIDLRKNQEISENLHCQTEEVFNDVSLSSHCSEFPNYEASKTKTQDSMINNTRSTSNSLHNVENAFILQYLSRISTEGK
jgi:hypothetical protein